VIGGQISLYEPPRQTHTVAKQGTWDIDELADISARTFGSTLNPPIGAAEEARQRAQAST